MTVFSPIEPVAAMKPVSDPVGKLRAAWKDKDYGRTIVLAHELLQAQPQNALALGYLCRAAVATSQWAEAASTGLAVVRSNPLVAFNAARKLTGAGHVREATQILDELKLDDDWLDAGTADLVWKQGIALLKSGDEAMSSGDAELAKAAWMAGARLCPRSRILSGRVREMAEVAKQAARQMDRDNDAAAYIEAWREVLKLEPTNLSAAKKVALALGRGPEKAATMDAWLKVLEIDPVHEKAIEKVRGLAEHHDLADRAIQGLTALGRDGATDPLVHALVIERDEKASKADEQALKSQLKIAMLHARAADRDADPRRFLTAWKEVLVLDPGHTVAARKVISTARELGDGAELVDGLIALVDIDPADSDSVARLISAGLNRYQEQKALDCLAAHGHVDLSEPRIEKLFTRVHRMCKDALREGNFPLALSCFQTLERVNAHHPWMESLRPVLAKRAATSAKAVERDGHWALAVHLAESVLEIEPDHPAALGVVARDMLREKRFGDVIALCQPKLQPDEEWEPVRKVVERATMKLSA